MNFYLTKRVLLCSAVAFAFTGPAFALDGQDLLNKINAVYGKQGGTVSAQSVDVSGDTVVLKSAKITPSSAEASPVNIGDVTLSSVEEKPDGGYLVGKAAFAPINYSADGTVVTVSAFELGEIAVPANASAEGVEGFFYAGTIKAGPAKVAKDGKELFSLSSVDFENAIRDDKSGFDVDGKVTNIKINGAELAQDPQTRDAVEKLGIQNIEGSITTKGAWTFGPGTLDVSSIAVDFDKIGKLDFSLKISGYTFALMKSLHEATEQAEKNPNKEEAQQAMGLAMIGLMQQLSLEGARIRFEDDSITKRALDYAGSRQNVSGEQMAASLKGIVPLMMAQLNMPDLQNAVTAAVNTYLDNPQNITINVSPDKPVPFPTVMGAAMGAPNTLPQVLGLKISANTDN